MEGGKHYTLRNIVVEKYGAIINQHAKDNSSDSGGSFLGAYSKKTLEIMQGLDDNERAELEQQIDEWNARGPPDGSKTLHEYVIALLSQRNFWH
jgi:hypothetical protein